MRQHAKKRQANRNQFRKKQIEQYMNQERNFTIKIHEQIETYQREGKYGAYLLVNIFQKSQNREEVKELQKTYPLQTLYVFLDLIYDQTQWQLIAIKIIENYFFIGFSTLPQECFIDKALRILLRSTNPEVLTLILLIFSQILEDNHRYGNYLMQEKKLIPSLLTLLQNFPNNKSIVNLVHRVMHSLIFNVDWNEEILKLIDPLFRMMHQSQTVQITSYIQTLYSITQFKASSEEIIAKIHEKEILKICTNVINQYHSRLTSYHYLEFVKILKSTLKMDEIEEIISTIGVIRDFNFKIGEQSGKYSVLNIKTKAYSIVKSFLRQSKSELSEFTYSLLSKYQLVQKILEQFEEARDLGYEPELFNKLGEIVLFFYSKCKEENYLCYKSKILAALELWQGTEVWDNLKSEFDDISQYVHPEITEMEIQI